MHLFVCVCVCVCVCGVGVFVQIFFLLKVFNKEIPDNDKQQINELELNSSITVALDCQYF
jgi:hypothetical protein